MSGTLLFSLTLSHYNEDNFCQIEINKQPENRRNKMKKQIKSNWQTIVFAAIVSLVIMFAGSSPATAQTTYKVADRIEVQYGSNAWYPAEVIEVKDGSYKVHYDGYSTSDDEWVKLNRMRQIGGKSPTVNQNNAGSQAENQTDKNSRATYKVGNYIEVQYDNFWYRAAVVEVKDGLYKVHYDGDKSYSDQWVKPNQMRQIGGKPTTAKPNNAGDQTQAQKGEDNQAADEPKETITGNKYGTRDPQTCADKKAPARGAITAALALKYLICEHEKVSGGYLYLVENVTVQVGGGIPFNPNANLNVPDIDVRFPLYSIRGSLIRYQCNPANPLFDHSAPGKNCQKTIMPKASGSCYRTTFGEWRCYMSDNSNNSENWFPGVAPPPPKP